MINCSSGPLTWAHASQIVASLLPPNTTSQIHTRLTRASHQTLVITTTNTTPPLHHPVSLAHLDVTTTFHPTSLSYPAHHSYFTIFTSRSMSSPPPIITTVHHTVTLTIPYQCTMIKWPPYFTHHTSCTLITHHTTAS
ncbi:hypothetical protein E2C01_046251 [Portunus trituberculatus]|uniref:Uncharacterized protein n=1 Tax=Portunus trituberculatus TaxID=210409 RepID=A0A5B7G568_PORTR|nr:hypothetical protein [Portunus trituberculatus]